VAKVSARENNKALKRLRRHSAYKGPRVIVTLVLVTIGFIVAVRLLGDMEAASRLSAGARRSRILRADVLSLVALVPFLYLCWFFLQLLIDIADSLILANRGKTVDSESGAQKK